jgi:plasmid stability protein
MRTTLNLDEDVAQQLTARARRHGRSLSRVANELLRAGLLAQQRPVVADPYDAPEVDTGRPLIDVTDIGEALELLERDRGA